jgi:hypothetical protein
MAFARYRSLTTAQPGQAGTKQVTSQKVEHRSDPPQTLTAPGLQRFAKNLLPGMATIFRVRD